MMAGAIILHRIRVIQFTKNGLDITAAAQALRCIEIRVCLLNDRSVTNM
jgi:hypothetical protein